MCTLGPQNSSREDRGSVGSSTTPEPSNDRASLFRPPEQGLRIMAHQGAQGQFPSNSLKAIEAALGVAEAIEFDVYALPHEGGVKIVAHHPETYFFHVNPGGMKNTEQLPLSFEETRDIRVKGERLIPTLDEILQVYQERVSATGKRTELQIELKGPDTSEAVVSQMKKAVADGILTREDYALTGLCYPGDRSRLEKARELDPDVRLVFVLRGGDFSQDGFADIDEVVEFGKKIKADVITISRRAMDPAVVQRLKEEGFRVGCYHSRTSDELEAALALGTDYVAADYFQGSSFEQYPDVRLQGSPLYVPLSEAGFYVLRDFIWEFGWDLDKTREAAPVARDFKDAEKFNAADAFLVNQADSTLVMGLAEKGCKTERLADLEFIKISEKFLGASDKPGEALGKMLSEKGQEKGFQNLAYSLLTIDSSKASEEFLGLLANLEFKDIVDLSEGRANRALQGDKLELSPEQLTFLEELSREYLTRSGRILGAMAFAALAPRHGPKEAHTLMIDSHICKQSFWARKAANEQVQAQFLRSGKSGQLQFAEVEA